MADDKQPKKAAEPGKLNYLGGLTEGLKAGFAGVDWDATSNNAEALRQILERVQFPATAAEAIEQQKRNMEPAVAGGSEPKKRKRNTAGKTYLHGADRTVRYYKPTEAELDRLGELSKDESSARASMAFCVGIVANIVLGLVFAVGLSPASRGVAFGIGLCAAFAAYKFYRDAERKRADGKSALERVKKDHDFANI